MNDFNKLIKRMGVRRKYIILLLLRAPFDALRTWMLANLLKAVFLCLEAEACMAVQNGNRPISGSLLEICTAYGLISAMLFVYNGTIWSIYAAFSARTEAGVLREMFQKILGLPLKRIDSRFSGEWATKLNSDIQAAFTMMSGPMNIPHLTVAVINTMLSSFFMQKSSPLFLGVIWIFILAQYLLNYEIVLKAVPKLKEEAQNALSESTSAIEPLITDADTILIYGAEELMMKSCVENSRKMMKIHMKMHVRNAQNDAIMRLLGIGGYLVILLLGCGFIDHGTMAFSDLVYCLQVRVSMIAGMSMIMTCINNLKANSVCIKRITDTLDE